MAREMVKNNDVSLIDDLFSKEPSWLLDKRKKALQKYLESNLPDRVTHRWKYSFPEWFIADPAFELTKNINCEKVSFPNLQGELIVSHLSDSFLKSDESHLFKQKFGSLLLSQSNKLSYMNDFLWSSGLFIYLPKGIRLEEPIVIKSSSAESNKCGALRLFVFLEENSSLSIIDESAFTGNNLLVNSACEMFLSKGATLNFLSLQNNSHMVTQYYASYAKLGENAKFTNFVLAFGGRKSKTDLFIDLEGSSSSAETYGLVLGDDEQVFDHHTLIEHKSPNTKSLLDFRVVLKDKSNSAYTGNLKILNSAIKSNAKQENRNLLLSPNAKAESIPELEILTNDVDRCNHGVTVGQVDREQVYYLMSRGLSEKEAQRLIVEGFFQPTISKILHEQFRHEITNFVTQKIGEY